LNDRHIFLLTLVISGEKEMQSHSLLHIDEKDFEREVLESAVPTVADFYADWCGPCRIVGPTIEALSREYDGKVKFVKVNVDDNQQLAMKYDIESIPTVMIFKNGEVIERVVGARPAQFYRQKINLLLGIS
jgi:thioredoxin 1